METLTNLDAQSQRILWIFKVLLVIATENKELTFLTTDQIVETLNSFTLYEFHGISISHEELQTIIRGMRSLGLLAIKTTFVDESNEDIVSVSYAISRMCSAQINR